MRYLEGVINTRDEELRRRGVIISQLTQRIPELEPNRNSAHDESLAETRETSTATTPTGKSMTDVQETLQPRSRWSRVFGS